MQAQKFHLYGLIFFMIMLHALHVVGGFVALVRVVDGAARRRYHHEQFHPVRQLAMYWHFLDGVWVIMFSMLLITQ